MKQIRYLRLIVFFALFSCNKLDYEVPAGYVDVVENLGYGCLKSDGMICYLGTNEDGTIAGLNGVLVYRENYDMFHAFECTCPLDTCPLIYDEKESFILECECCESWFSAITGYCMDGYAAQGKYLRAYKAYRNGGYLYVRNN